MSCADAPSAIIVDSPMAASRTKARTTRLVFKRIVPPYFRFSLVYNSHGRLARPRDAGGPLFLFAIWRVKKANQEPPPFYNTHDTPESFNWCSVLAPSPSIYHTPLIFILSSPPKPKLS